MTENWKSLSKLVEHGDNYEVSSTGKVRSIKTGVVLKPFIKANGYQTVSLHKSSKSKTFYVHRLVALSFIPNPDNKPEVNHINGTKADNRVTNLEWVTPKENIQHAIENRLSNSVGANNPNAVLNEEVVKEIKQLYSSGQHTQDNLAKKFSVSKQTINNIVHGKSWTHVTIDRELVVHNKGRSGENNSQSKLTVDDVRKMRELYKTGNYSFRSLGKLFGVSRTVAGRVVTYKSWKHVS